MQKLKKFKYATLEWAPCFQRTAPVVHWLTLMIELRYLTFRKCKDLSETLVRDDQRVEEQLKPIDRNLSGEMSQDHGWNTNGYEQCA